MRNFILLSFFILIIGCSTEKELLNQAEQDNFEIFRQSSASFGKVFQDNDGTYVFKAYGDFMPTINDPALFIPKNITFVEQSLIGSNEKIIIQLNDFLMPKTFYKKTSDGDVEDNKYYHVFYNEQKTTIHIDTKQNNQFITENIIELPGMLGASRPSLNRNSTEDGQCNEPCPPPNDLNPCNDTDLYYDQADNWEEEAGNTGHSMIEKAGKFIKWITKKATQKICGGPSNRLTSSSNSLTCEDYKLDDDKTDDDICEILISCNQDCSGKLYGSAYYDNCNVCVGGTTNLTPCNLSEIDSTEIYKASCIGNWTVTGYDPNNPPTTYEFELFSNGTGQYNIPATETSNAATYPITWHIQKYGNEYRLYESGFWHFAYNSLVRDKLTYPVSTFKTYGNFDPNFVTQIYIKN